VPLSNSGPSTVVTREVSCLVESIWTPESTDQNPKDREILRRYAASFFFFLLTPALVSHQPRTPHLTSGNIQFPVPQTQNSPTPSDVLDLPTPTRFGATHCTFSFCSRPALHSRRSFGNGGKRPHALETPQRQTTAPWDQRLRWRLARRSQDAHFQRIQRRPAV
jgi:hypothetical protein